MKKYLFLLLIFLTASVVKAQDSLHIKLDSLLRDPLFETTQVGLMVYDLDAQRALVTQGSHTDQLERMGKAILQAASKDLASRGTIEATNH